MKIKSIFHYTFWGICLMVFAVFFLERLNLFAQSNPASPEIQELIQKLADEEKRHKAEYQLKKLGRKVVPDLISALKHENQNIRYFSARLLGQIGDPRAIPALIEAHKDETIAYEVTRALATIGGPKVVPTLLKGLKHENEWRRASAAKWLGAIGDSRAIKPLMALLKEDKEWCVRAAAASALGSFRWPEVRSSLEQAKDDDPNWRVYRAARKALRKIKGDWLFRDRELKAYWHLSVLRKYLEPPEGREEFIRSHLAQPEPVAWSPTKEAFATQEEMERAKERLIDMGEPAVERAIEALSSGHLTTSAQERIQTVLIAIGKKAVPSLIIAAERGEPHMQARCAQVMGEIGDKRTLPVLNKLLQSKYSYGRENAKRAIEKIESAPNG